MGDFCAFSSLSTKVLMVKYFSVGVAKRQRDLYPIVYAIEANTKQGRSLMETIVTEILEIIKGAKDSISREERIRSSPEDLA